MKVLELAPYVFIAGHPHGERNKSGLAYMIRSVCDMVSTKNDVHVLTQSILTDEQRVGEWLLLKRNVFTVLTHFKLKYFLLAFKVNQHNGLLGFFRRLIYCISAGQAEDYIKQWQPDVIHIHTIGFYSIPYLQAAASCNVPVITTLHGLVSFNNIVPASQMHKRVERVFLRVCVDNDYVLTFISSGMKQKVQAALKKECNNITVIPNCFRPVPHKVQIRQDDGCKRIICVGSLYPLKNQIQVIKALPIVQKAMAKRAHVLLDIYGDGISKNAWMKFCQENQISGVVFHGRKSQEEVFCALSKANLLVFPSIEEGFGIPIVEAYECGTPVVTFSDLDASKDIANEDCCIFAKERTDESLAEAIIEALEKEWDNDRIRDYAQNFTMEATSKKYCLALEQKIKPISQCELNKIINSCKNKDNE